MPTFLDQVVEHTERTLEKRKAAMPYERLAERLEPIPRGRPFSEALIDEGISLIAEMKRASPSRGPINPGAAVADIVRAYRDAAVSAISVLTEPHWFKGSLDDLVEARRTVDLPLLRKDFIVDPYQLLEARVAGADAVLLIVAALGRERLDDLMRGAHDLGLDCLVEVHDEDEVETAVEAGAEIIGINNRDLHSLEVDLETTFRLLPDIPAGTVVVAESGITERGHVRDLEDAGVDAILVGEALMSSGTPAEAARRLRD
ncbi:MAG: indole-3-glycerol phosphate synthase TrpC [Thermoleophilia bacterium]|nr:indole-3-glycerol phosphate synthase TrpC [Thermoleophilia bacterium]